MKQIKWVEHNQRVYAKGGYSDMSNDSYVYAISDNHWYEVIAQLETEHLVSVRLSGLREFVALEDSTPIQTPKVVLRKLNDKELVEELNAEYEKMTRYE